MEPFSVDSLEAAFRELSEELRFRRARAHIYIIGGAAIALGFDNRRLTVDIDAVVEAGHGHLMEAVSKIAYRHRWPSTWLNEQAVMAVPRRTDHLAQTVYADRNLTVTGASAKHLLAMKVRAGRPKDAGDIAFLAERLGLHEARQVWDLHDQVFPDAPPRRTNFQNAAGILARLWPADRSMDGDNRYGHLEGRNAGRGGLRH